MTVNQRRWALVHAMLKRHALLSDAQQFSPEAIAPYIGVCRETLYRAVDGSGMWRVKRPARVGRLADVWLAQYWQLRWEAGRFTEPRLMRDTGATIADVRWARAKRDEIRAVLRRTYGR